MQYYTAKSMTPEQIATFVEERKWDYRGTSSPLLAASFLAHLKAMTTAFGFTAALVERLPIVGLVFSVSNRIGAAMWAHGERGNISTCFTTDSVRTRPREEAALCSCRKGRTCSHR